MRYSTLAATAILAAAAFALAGPSQAAPNSAANGGLEVGEFTGPLYGDSGAYMLAFEPAVVPDAAFGGPIQPDNEVSLSTDPAEGYAAYFVAEASDEVHTILLPPGIYKIGFSGYVPQVLTGVPATTFTLNPSTPKRATGFTGGTEILVDGADLGAFTYRSSTVTTRDLLVDRPSVITDTLRTAVPEPGTWVLSIVGFGAAGAMLRRRRAATA